MKILVFGCHPDDVEIACAGTLARCVRRGDEVTVCHVANGNLGHVLIGKEELREIRIGEAKKAGSMAGIRVITADLGDLEPNAGDMEQRKKIADIIRAEQPDLLITHAPGDYMPDHREVSKLVFDASFAASVPHYSDGKAAELTPLYYMDTLAGMNFNPTEYVDITETVELKLKMLECHESQIVWMRDHDHIDFVDFVRTCAKFRGLQCNAAYAEGFTQAYVWPKVITKRLLP